jgi:hypothetical protein
MTRSRDTADTQDNLGGAVAPFVAGKNKVINGDFGVWQRGTTFSNPASGSYFADRWKAEWSGTPTTYSFTQQTFTPGTAPVAGYEGQFFFRSTITTVGTLGDIDIKQAIENVRTFAGQTVTLSFWAKSDTSRTSIVYLAQVFGSGGSTTVITATPNLNTTSSWQRFSFTLDLASISGKTIGTNSALHINIRQATASGSVLDLWGVQLEAGSVATPFTTASGSIGGELALCQRYYQQIGGDNASQEFCVGQATSTTNVDGVIFLPVIMRVAPTVTFTSTASQFAARSATGAEQAGTATSSVRPVPSSFVFRVTVASGLVAGNACTIAANGSTSPRIYISAEL